MKASSSPVLRSTLHVKPVNRIKVVAVPEAAERTWRECIYVGATHQRHEDRFANMD